MGGTDSGPAGRMRAAFRLGKALSRPLEDHKVLCLSGSYFHLSSFDFQISILGGRGMVTFYHVLSEQVQGNPHKQGETGVAQHPALISWLLVLKCLHGMYVL